MITRNFNLFLNAGKHIPLVINVNQYDHDEQWCFTLLNDNGEKYIPSTGAIVGIKADRLGIINSGTVNASGQVVINETEQMTAAVGKAVFELLIDDQTHGTANFAVLVEPKPGNNADFSESDLSLLQEAIDGTSAAAIAEGVGNWMDDNLEPGEWVIDSSLTVQGAAADAKKVGDEISDLKSQISDIEEQIEGGTGTGMSADFKVALDSFMTAMLTLADNVAYDDDTSGDSIYTDIETAKNAVHSAMYPPADLTSISAVYTPSGTVYANDSLDDLKSDLVVTAHYSDGNSNTVTDYVLTGNLTVGTSVITVTYGGKTTNFSVTVEPAHPLYQWDFTQSATDLWQNKTVTPATNAEITGNGLYLNSKASGVTYTGKVPLGGYAVIEFGTANATSGANRIFLEEILQFGYRGASSKFSAYYNGSWHDDEVTTISNVAYFTNKTLYIYIDLQGGVKFVCDGQIILNAPNRGIGSTGSYVAFGTWNNNMCFTPMYIRTLTIYSEGTAPSAGE